MAASTNASLLIIFSLALTLATATIHPASDHHETTTGQCSQQMREQREGLNHCRKYIMNGSSATCWCSGSRFSDYRGTECSCQTECCKGLTRMDDEECACEAMRMIVDDQEEMMEREMAAVMRRAREMPRYCGISQQCEMHGSGSRYA